MVVVGGRGDLQGLADRLDPEPLPVSVDERSYFGCRRSSSAPKKIAADFSISFARRSSRFSFLARVNPFEADFWVNHWAEGLTSSGLLIQTAVGSAGGAGGRRTKRSGCAA